MADKARRAMRSDKKRPLNRHEVLDGLAENVRAFRLHEEWSQAELGRRTRLTRANVSAIEGGLIWVGPDVLYRLAAAFDVDVGDLLP